MAAIQFTEDTVAGALRTNAAHGVLAAASSIYDREKQKFQSDINEEVQTKLANTKCELSEIRITIRTGDYTLDFGRFGEVISEVVMFSRTIKELHLVNVGSLYVSVNGNSPLYLVGNTENNAEGPPTLLVTQEGENGYNDTLVSLGSLPSGTQLEWGMRRMDDGSFAAIGVKFTEIVN